MQSISIPKNRKLRQVAAIHVNGLCVQLVHVGLETGASDIRSRIWC
jgi:hypothetical protein